MSGVPRSDQCRPAGCRTHCPVLQRRVLAVDGVGQASARVAANRSRVACEPRYGIRSASMLALVDAAWYAPARRSREPSSSSSRADSSRRGNLLQRLVRAPCATSHGAVARCSSSPKPPGVSSASGGSLRLIKESPSSQLDGALPTRDCGMRARRSRSLAADLQQDIVFASLYLDGELQACTPGALEVLVDAARSR